MEFLGYGQFPLEFLVTHPDYEDLAVAIPYQIGHTVKASGLTRITMHRAANKAIDSDKK
jgi:hypothetical protein